VSPVKVIICGSKGRMGRSLIACAQSDPELQIVAEIDQGDDLAKVIARADAIIDFSVREATAVVAKLAADHKKALVIGTTGHGHDEKKMVLDVLNVIPVVWSANFSTGVNTLFWLTQKAAEVVGNEWDAEVVETHHTAKKDAPSGTAKRLQEILKQARGKEAPAHALRIGDVVGDHTVTFGTTGERLELTHRASSR
jgi:4-hydroxy-tetrahydrodipicolinate reductase